MTRGVLIALGLGLSSHAFAQGLDFKLLETEEGETIYLITDDMVPWSSNGAGSPNLAYDTVNEQYVMYFNAELTQDYIADSGIDYQHCYWEKRDEPVVWTVGRATSPDGTTWTKQGRIPVSRTTEGLVSAVTAQTVGERIHLWVTDAWEGEQAVGYFLFEPGS